ncbi:MAG TPA: type I DNA topoisomerase, partial [Candidatus Omnitrophica bacterium]|nr:type I DNA topoisomerase [Candidatus Omnitrophota bacterium]
MKSGAKDSSRVLLATDPDREGETICWHLKEELKSINSNIFRILFQEITQDAIKDALKNLTTLDINKVDAGKARRILDRLVGYKISPLLWKKVRKGLSAGRVQTVALRFVVEREKEIEAFISEEYYLIFGKFSSSEGDFLAQLKKIKGKKFSRLSKEDAYGKKEDIERQSFMVKSVVIKEEKKSPPPPFITSTLQQEAHRLFRFSSGRTMAIAQSLYGGVDIAEKRTGLITYMRTDSFRIATLAQKKARDYIGERFGEEYLPTSPPRYKSRKGAQEAHEAIRPTYVELAPEKVKEYLDQGQFKLYSLIYNRFLASQMARAIIEVRTVEVKGGDYIFAADERKTKFAGYQILFKREERKDVPSLPLLREGEEVDLIELRLEQKFTQPPPRYTEGTLIRKLEEEGIGRPSTYAPIMNVIKDRDYVRSIKGQLHPTELGRIVVDLLVENFPSIFHAKFTSKIEKSLDEIEENKKRWRKIVEDFYESFEPALEKAFVEMKNIKKERERPTGEECPRCGGALIIKEGRYG